MSDDPCAINCTEFLEQARLLGMSAERELKLRADLAKEKAKGIHSCFEGCTRDGCVNVALRKIIEELRLQNAILICQLADLEHP